MAEKSELQKIAQEIVSKGLVKQAAEACGVDEDTVRGWADGTRTSDIPGHDITEMEDVLINN